MGITEWIEKLQREIEDAFDYANTLKLVHESTINQFLAKHTTRHRKYPDGYAFTYRGKPCTLSRAWSYYEQGEIIIAYVVSCDGEEIDTLIEKNIDSPDYA